MSPNAAAFKDLLELCMMFHSVLLIVNVSLEIVTSSPVTVTVAGNVTFFLIPFIVRLPLTLSPSTLVISNAAVANFSTSKKSSPFKWLTNLPLASSSAGISVHAIVLMSNIKVPPTNLSPSNSATPLDTFIVPSCPPTILFAFQTIIEVAASALNLAASVFCATVCASPVFASLTSLLHATTVNPTMATAKRFNTIFFMI